jgi:uncharacterized protein (DUF952 family)
LPPRRVDLRAARAKALPFGYAAAADMAKQLVYKICARAEWDAAVAAGEYVGSADDARDGFIHFSTAEQVEATAAKYFAGRSDLVLIEVDAAQLGPELRFEPSRGGALFPHLYGALPLTAVVSARAYP